MRTNLTAMEWVFPRVLEPEATGAAPVRLRLLDAAAVAELRRAEPAAGAELLGLHLRGAAVGSLVVAAAYRRSPGRRVYGRAVDIHGSAPNLQYSHPGR